MPAAREIVRALGGFTLAVEQVALYLGLHPDVSPTAFLATLKERRGIKLLKWHRRAAPGEKPTFGKNGIVTTAGKRRDQT